MLRYIFTHNDHWKELSLYIPLPQIQTKPFPKTINIPMKL